MQRRSLDGCLILHWIRLQQFMQSRGAGEGAEDCMQELWIKVQVEPQSHIISPLDYLYRMAANLVADQRRSAGRQCAREASYAEDRLGRIRDNDDAPLADRVLIGKQNLRDAQAVISALGPRTSYVLRRCRVDNARHLDVASEIGMTISGIEKHLQIAYRAIALEKNRQTSS